MLYGRLQCLLINPDTSLLEFFTERIRVPHQGVGGIDSTRIDVVSNRVELKMRRCILPTDLIVNEVMKLSRSAWLSVVSIDTTEETCYVLLTWVETSSLFKCSACPSCTR